MSDTNVPDLAHLASVYYGLLLVGGQICLPILILILCVSRSVKRHPTIINFLATWVVYSIIYCLLYYGGHDVNPPHELCVVQASLIYGAPCMAVIAALAVVVHVFWTFYNPWKCISNINIPRYIQVVMWLSPPYLTLAVFAGVAGHYSTGGSADLKFRNDIYCSLVTPFARFAVPAFCASVILIILMFEVAIMVKYVRTWVWMKQVCPDADVGRVSISPWIRAAIFLVCSSITLAACVVLLIKPRGVAPYIVEASLPLAAFLVFGMQKDVLEALSFWKTQSTWAPDHPELNASSTRTTTPTDRTTTSVTDSDDSFWLEQQQVSAV